jgi:protein-tyrosine-phosphatase
MFTKETIYREHMLSILIVCSANICRSPMAEAILKRLVADRPDADQWYIESAGTWANYGSPAALLSQFVAQTMGMDISTHQSQPVTLELMQQFDLILTMEGRQKEGLTLQFKPYADRIFMISEMIGRVEDIPDPIGGELVDYQETYRVLERILSDGMNRIYQLAVLHHQ